MEEKESVLDTINEEDDFENMEDVDMDDVEEGEIVVKDGLDSEEKQIGDGDGDKMKEGILGKTNGLDKPNMNKKKKKKKKKRRKPMDLDRFVRDTCRRLKEKKSYMIYTAVGCLGIPALSDLINEFKMFPAEEYFAAPSTVPCAEILLVEAIETCGGQVTADGSRKRTGGGVLWNIIKARQPAAYGEIMKKSRKFEKQFRHPNTRPNSGTIRDSSSEGHASASADEALVSDLHVLHITPVTENESKPQERKSVHERIRVPVSYDDLFKEGFLDASQAQHSSA